MINNSMPPMMYSSRSAVVDCGFAVAALGMLACRVTLPDSLRVLPRVKTINRSAYASPESSGPPKTPGNSSPGGEPPGIPNMSDIVVAPLLLVV
jgi:hypothetical protein